MILFSSMKLKESLAILRRSGGSRLNFEAGGYPLVMMRWWTPCLGMVLKFLALNKFGKSLISFLMSLLETFSFDSTRKLVEIALMTLHLNDDFPSMRMDLLNKSTLILWS